MREYSKGVVLRFDEAVQEKISNEDLQTFKNVANAILDLVNSKKIYTTEKIK